MKFLLVIDYQSIEELQEKLERYVIDDRGSDITDRAEECSPGVLWDDDGVIFATIPDQYEVTVQAAVEEPADPSDESSNTEAVSSV